MIDLYYWGTPNGHEITIMLEELSMPYNIIPVDIRRDTAQIPRFLEISPGGYMPAIVDHAPISMNSSCSVFESGAILLYLAEKTGKFLSVDPVQRLETVQWLVWQVGNFGPILGQLQKKSQGWTIYQLRVKIILFNKLPCYINCWISVF